MHANNLKTLESIRLTTYGIEKNVKIEAALAGVPETITSVASVRSEHKRGEKHLLEFYKAAVIAHEWPDIPIADLDSQKFGVLEFYRRLVRHCRVLSQKKARSESTTALFDLVNSPASSL